MAELPAPIPAPPQRREPDDLQRLRPHRNNLKGAALATISPSERILFPTLLKARNPFDGADLPATT